MESQNLYHLARPCCYASNLPSASQNQLVHLDMWCAIILQLEKAVQHIASRVDELALQPEVYSARVESQLTALASEQRALQVQRATGPPYFLDDLGRPSSACAGPCQSSCPLELKTSTNPLGQ